MWHDSVVSADHDSDSWDETLTIRMTRRRRRHFAKTYIILSSCFIIYIIFLNLLKKHFFGSLIILILFNSLSLSPFWSVFLCQFASMACSTGLPPNLGARLWALYYQAKPFCGSIYCLKKLNSGTSNTSRPVNSRLEVSWSFPDSLRTLNPASKHLNISKFWNWSVSESGVAITRSCGNIAMQSGAMVLPSVTGPSQRMQRLSPGEESLSLGKWHQPTKNGSVVNYNSIQDPYIMAAIV